MKGEARKHYNAAFSVVKRDSAMMSEVGGVDFNEIEVERQGSGPSVQFDSAVLQSFKEEDISGFVLVIMGLTPIKSPLVFLGLEAGK